MLGDEELIVGEIIDDEEFVMEEDFAETEE